MKINISAILLILVLLGCSNDKKKETEHKINNKKTEVLNIICDSIYKGYKLNLTNYDPLNEDTLINNSVLSISKFIDGNYYEIFRDSIFNCVPEIKFIDFSNDNIRDIMIQNNSDVRSNWTYYLYILDTISNKIKKIKGFEKIKNPTFNKEYNLIENYVNSGRNWTEFYKIKGDSIFDFEITLYDGQDENGENTYERDLLKARETILKWEKKSIIKF